MKIICDQGHPRRDLATVEKTRLGWLATQDRQEDLRVTGEDSERVWRRNSTQVSWDGKEWMNTSSVLTDFMEFADEDATGPRHRRHVFFCPKCKRSDQYSGDRLDPILEGLSGANQSEVSLSLMAMAVDRASRFGS